MFLGLDLEYWLVNHPTIRNFSWIPGKTLGSSPLFLCLTILSYLFSTFILPHRIPLPSIPPQILKPISALHNISLLLLSFIMALGCLLSVFCYAPHLQWIICLPPHTKPTGPLFFWAYIFYLSKILEFVDTLLIILSNSIKRLTFLHVYHHSTVVVMCYIWLQTSQTLFPAVLFTNASVHVLMYAYYLSCALGVRPRWKKLVTNVQIMQFYSSFGVLGVMLYYHFTGSGCSGVWGWVFNVVFYASLLALFVDFHKKSYGAPAASSKKNLAGAKPSKPLFYFNHTHKF
ncbi:putative elongation of fatty acids protein DDB_G0272012 [Cajanus cajan]|uniref:putative elongation of fatty acids protein DDB_G0272012 n=1 Tax=Cajanus cajan TaxID=3821 RepID=UPI0010FAE314|nr:putative elongation of fatty acids protein DDB_G0272012 [Cajanus cajan]